MKQQFHQDFDNDNEMKYESIETQKERICSHATYVRMQEELESDSEKEILEELVSQLLSEGHVESLNNFLDSSATKATPSSGTAIVTELVEFLVDGGANTCLTKFATRLWRKSKPQGKSSGAGGLSLSPQFQGFLKLMLPGMKKGTFLRAMSVNSSDPSAFEILAQPMLEKLGYIFIFAGERGAYMITPEGVWQKLKKDSATGLWMITLPIEIPANGDVHHCNLEEEHPSVHSNAILTTSVPNLPDRMEAPSKRRVTFSMDLAEEENDGCNNTLFTETNASMTESTARDLPEDALLLEKRTRTDYSQPILYFSANPEDKYHFLSESYLSTFEVDQNKFISLEHFILYQKCLTIRDIKRANHVLSVKDSTKLYAIDEDIEQSSEELLSLWDMKAHYNALLEGIRLKFQPHPYLREQLLMTYPRPLAKLSKADDESGIGLDLDQHGVDDLHEWGANLLGMALQVVRNEFQYQSETQSRAYVQNLSSMAPETALPNRIFQLKCESVSYALRNYLEKFSKYATTIINGINNDIPIDDEIWILLMFPTPIEGNEPKPKTYLEHSMQNIFIESVPESYFSILEILRRRIEGVDYDIFKVFTERHHIRLRTFVKWFKGARRVPFEEPLSSREKVFRSRLETFASFRDVLSFALWPASPNPKHIALRENLLRSSGFGLHMQRNASVPFKNLLHHVEYASPPQGQKNVFNPLKGFGARSYHDLHCSLGHPNDQSVHRTLQGAGIGTVDHKTLTKNCPICAKLRLNKISRPPTPLYQAWANPIRDVVFRDVHGPLVTATTGERFWEIFVSSTCRKIWIFPIRSKDDVLKNMVIMAQEYTAKGRCIAMIINDNAKEYVSKQMKAVLRKYNITLELMPDYTKNGNIAEVCQRLVEGKTMANNLEGLAPPVEWPNSSKYGAIQLNNLVCLSARQVILNYCTPDQLWGLPNDLLSGYYADMLKNKLNIEDVMLNVRPTDLKFFRKFWSLVTVRDVDKKLGQVPENGLAKEGTFVYLRPSQNKQSFVILDLATRKEFTTAFAEVNEDSKNKKCLLTNYDLQETDSSTRPLSARRIRNSFDLSENLQSIRAKEESSSDTSLTSTQSQDSMESEDVYPQSDEKATNDEMLSEDDESDESSMDEDDNDTTSRPSSTLPELDLDDRQLSDEIRVREKKYPDLPDAKRRRNQMYGDHLGVQKLPFNPNQDLADILEEELADEELNKKDEKIDKEYLVRYSKANLPISYHQECPKKAKTKSAVRYNKYKSASTIAEALRLGAIWGDIVWDYQRGFLRCLSSLERRRLNNLVQKCVNDDIEDSLPKIGNEVTVFSIDPNHPAFGKSGRLVRAAPQLTPLSNQIHVLTQDRSKTTCKWCAEDDTESASEEENATKTQQYPPRQSLFRNGDLETDDSTIAYFDFHEDVLEYVPAINQLTEDFSIDTSPPTSTDAKLNPEDMLYVFETVTDDNQKWQFVSPLKAFTQNSGEFVSRKEMLKEATRYVYQLVEDMEDRQKYLRENEESFPNLKEYANAISESTRLLSRTFNRSPHYVNAITGETVVCPKDIHEAIRLDRDRWGSSMLVEMQQLINLKTWTLIPKSELRGDDNITGTMWAYRIKADGRYKSRLCAQGYSQQLGIDFWDSYSSVATIESIRVAIALAAANKRRLKTFDVKNAFQNTPLPEDERVICQQAPGFKIHPTDEDKTMIDWYKSLGLEIPDSNDPNDTFYLKLSKSMQGLRSSGRHFQKHLFEWLKSEGFRQLKSDDCCWVYTDDTGIDIQLCVYVDDLLASSLDERSEQYFEKLFYDRWEGSTGSGTGMASALLGMNIFHYQNGDESCILLNNEVMIDDIAHTFGVVNSVRDYKSPMAEKFDPSYDEGQEDLDTSKFNYRSLCGALLFVVTHTRPDCSCACSQLCSAMARPQKKHWEAALRLARYLFQTKTLGLCYSTVAPEQMNKIHAYVDASWAAEKGARSRAGYIIKLNGASVCYRSKLINSICLSSAESETTACVGALKDIIWLRMHLWELGYDQPGSTPVYEDNAATISASSGNSQTKQSRYYQMKTEFIRQLVRTGTVHLVYVTTKDQTADALSKNLPHATFSYHQPGILGAQPARSYE